MFLGVVLLNMVRERFWCRYVCPAGALLGLVSRWNLVKLKIDAEKCNDCSLCALHCETQATPRGRGVAPGRMRLLLHVRFYLSQGSHLSAAPTAPAKSKPIDLSRRRLLLAPAFGLVAVPLFRPLSLHRACLGEAHSASRSVARAAVPRHVHQVR